MIVLNHVSLRFGNKVLFDDLHLTLQANDKLAVVGPSGVGKSSLLSMILGIVKPQRGVVQVKAQRLGMMFQDARLLPWLTVSQNLHEVLKPLQISKSERNKRITASLADIELSDAGCLYPHQLSGGMAQRVALARALVVKPDLLLLDEPFSALDVGLRRRLSTLLRHSLNEGVGVVYVTHQLADVLPLVNKVLVIDATHQGKCTTLFDLSDKLQKQHFLSTVHHQGVF